MFIHCKKCMKGGGVQNPWGGWCHEPKAMKPKQPPSKSAAEPASSSSSYTTPTSAPSQKAKLPQKAMPAKAAPKPSRPPPSEKPQQAPQKKKKTNQWSTWCYVMFIVYAGYGWWRDKIDLLRGLWVWLVYSRLRISFHVFPINELTFFLFFVRRSSADSCCRPCKDAVDW